MSDVRPSDDSVRPPTRSLRSGGGLGVAAGNGECGVEKLEGDVAMRPVFPVEDGAIALDTVDDALLNDDVLHALRDDEEQAEVPPCLPDVYQPTPSEFADHCITHYPFEFGANIVSKGVDVSSPMNTTVAIRMRDLCRWYRLITASLVMLMTLILLRSLKPPVMVR